MIPPPPPRQFYLTGRYRLRPDGDRVVLQLQERTRPLNPCAALDRWRDATPQDVMSMVGLQIEPTSLRIGGALESPPSNGSGAATK